MSPRIPSKSGIKSGIVSTLVSLALLVSVTAAAEAAAKKPGGKPKPHGTIIYPCGATAHGGTVYCVVRY
jgi:hypothetical protein